jgi:hypothetical protein
MQKLKKKSGIAIKKIFESCMCFVANRWGKGRRGGLGTEGEMDDLGVLEAV